MFVNLLKMKINKIPVEEKSMKKNISLYSRTVRISRNKTMMKAHPDTVSGKHGMS